MSASERPLATSFELADGVMLGVVILWATNSVLTKAALDRGLEPLIYVPVRFAIGTVAVFAWLKLWRVSLRVRRQDVPRLFVSGLTGFAIYNLLYVVGLSHTSVFSAAILVSLAPIFMLLIAAAFGLERVRPLQWLGVALSFVGVAIFIGDKLLAGEPALGDVLNVAAALSFAIYGLTTRNLVLRYGAPVTTAWSVLIGLIAVAPVTAGALRNENWASIDGLSWFAMFYAAVISMMVGYALWGWALARTGAGRSVPYLFLIPVFTGILSVLFRGDHLGYAQVIGGAVALAGVAIARRFARPTDRMETVLPTEETGMTPAVGTKPRAVPGP
jgi:drug/metabolite transporter (DMT)-like permease